MDVQTKVVILETDIESKIQIKRFMGKLNIVPVTVESVTELRNLLESTMSLGAVFLNDHPDRLGEKPDAIARDLRRIRHEIPLFLRRNEGDTLRDTDLAHSLFNGEYHSSNMDMLENLITRHIFSKNYPPVLVKLIGESSLDVLTNSFRGLDIQVSQPYTIRNDTVQGSVVSMIPLETNWCRGVMYLEARESDMVHLIAARKSLLVDHSKLTFQSVHDLFGELTNAIWGKFKASFLHDMGGQEARYRAQIPIVVNYGRSYLSLGKGVPQLCFDYHLRDVEGNLDGATYSLWQKIIFYLDWTPKEFSSAETTPKQLDGEGTVLFLGKDR